MFLIVESGSTKADWVTVDASGSTLFYKTKGINPATQSSFLDMRENKNLSESIKQATHIWYYGAGVIDDISKDKISSWLRDEGAMAEIAIESDILAAARACSNNNPGIICILGTGSNSCVYDGKNRIDSIPSLGYILGDEGSGTHLGKEVLRAYFCRKMPDVVKNSFESQYKITRETLINKVYLQNYGGSYIASFATFLTNADEAWKKEILLKVFRNFIEFRVCTLKDYASYPVHFVGSIAHHYKAYLNEALGEFGLELGNVIQQPINYLIEYHFKQIYK